jgi:hypothetical protein
MSCVISLWFKNKYIVPEMQLHKSVTDKVMHFTSKVGIEGLWFSAKHLLRMTSICRLLFLAPAYMV